MGIDDFDGDGRPDIAVTNSGTTVSILQNLCTVLPLPVDLLSFTGELEKDHVLLKWSTASEINNDYFIIEKSLNGIEFEKIAEIDGAGNSTSLLEYSCIDQNPVLGINYYRLKQTDFDGAFQFSDIIAVKYKDEYPDEVKLSIQSDAIFIYSFSTEKNLRSFELIDLAGWVVYKTNSSENELQISTVNFPKGLYSLRILDKFSCRNFKLLLQ